jgi:hypothetical protein
MSRLQIAGLVFSSPRQRPKPKPKERTERKKSRRDVKSRKGWQ